MGLLWSILTLCVLGLIAGAIARFILPGRQTMSLLTTSLLGVAGSFLGGYLASGFGGGGWSLSQFQPSGLIGSVIGALILLLGYSWLQKKT